MQRFRTIVALVLAVLWMPATQHCGLEAAGILAEHCESEEGSGGCSGSDSCAQDGCKLLEGGDYQSLVSLVKVAPPVTLLCACLTGVRAAPQEIHLEDTAVAVETARPRDWVPVWQFERRAAAPAHAPDSLIA